MKNTKTKGFITRKMHRLSREKDFLDREIKRIDNDILRLLREAIKIASKKSKLIWRRHLAIKDIDNLMPRLKGEEIVAAN
jgi:transposase